MNQTLCCALLVLAACANSESTRPAGESRDTVLAQAAKKGENAAPPMQLTQQDGEAIRAALVAWLKQSQLGDRDELLALTERAAIWEGADALINIGRWGVVAEGGQLIAKLRQRSNSEQGMAFDAPLTKENAAWKVREITPVHIHPRR